MGRTAVAVILACWASAAAAQVTFAGARVDARAWMRFGKHDGTFRYSDTSATYQVPLDDGSGDVDSPIRVIIADMDQDGFGDVLTANHGTYAPDGTMSVVINALSISP